MISCTDFIPAYSELFCYLEEHYGREAIDRYWQGIFKPGAGIPLSKYVDREGLRGCFSYWSISLNEEAADFSMYLNEKRGFFKLIMHHCPSKGRLLELQRSIGLKPYGDYCLHCDCYRAACEKAGLQYIFDFQNTDNAGCSILITDPRTFDGRIIMDADTEVMERKAADNVYFHPNFHFSLNRSLHYVGEHYGKEAVMAVMARYVHNVIVPQMGAVDLQTIEAKILEDYRRDNAPDAVQTLRTADRLTVTVRYCPAVRYMCEHDLWRSEWFRCSTVGVMEPLAALAGCSFTLEDYDEQTGAAVYSFRKQ